MIDVKGRGFIYSDDATLAVAGSAQATAYCGSLAAAGRGVSCVIVNVLCVYARL